MKKTLALLVLAAFLMVLAGCAAGNSQLTLGKVEKLAEKGTALTWSDFEGYQCEETGSGLYIRVKPGLLCDGWRAFFRGTPAVCPAGVPRK